MTPTQTKALRWINDFDHHEIQCRRGKRMAYGDPSTWTGVRLKGREGSIEITMADWDAIRHLIQPAPLGSKRMYELTRKGRTAITQI